MGEVLIAGLREIARKHKPIGTPRGMGLMCGVDVLSPATGAGDPATRGRIAVACFERGLIMLGCGTHTLRFAPPLCITQHELETGLAIFDEAVAATI